jgi:hypothetical protein
MSTYRLHVHNGQLCVNCLQSQSGLWPIEGIEIEGMKLVGPFPTKDPSVTMRLTLLPLTEDRQTVLPGPPVVFNEYGVPVHPKVGEMVGMIEAAVEVLCKSLIHEGVELKDLRAVQAVIHQAVDAVSSEQLLRCQSEMRKAHEPK